MDGMQLDAVMSPPVAGSLSTSIVIMLLIVMRRDDEINDRCINVYCLRCRQQVDDRFPRLRAVTHAAILYPSLFSRSRTVESDENAINTAHVYSTEVTIRYDR